MESQNRPKLDYLQINQIYGTTVLGKKSGYLDSRGKRHSELCVSFFIALCNELNTGSMVKNKKITLLWQLH